MERLTPRARILNVLRGGENDQVPWNGDLDYWMRYLRAEGLLEPRYDGPEGRVALHRDLGVGFYLQGHYPFRERCEGVTEEYRGRDRIVTCRTPRGDLREVWRYTPETYSEAPVEYLLKSPEDLPALCWLYAHTRYEADYTLCQRMNRAVGEQGVTLVYTPHTPFMELAALKAGIETLTYLIADEEPGLDELFGVMTERFEEAAAIAVAAPAECVMIPENLSSEVVGRAFYLRYLRPLHAAWTERIRRAGKASFLHMDGTLRGLMDLVSESGFDVLEALTPAPVGDMTLPEMRQAAGPRPILWGGIPGGCFTDSVTDEAFDRMVLDALACLRTDRRFVLGVADQVCPGATAKRIARVRELTDQFGIY